MKVLAFPGPRQRLPEEGEGPVDAPPVTTSYAAAPPPQYDRITVRAITVAIVLSLFVHILLLVSPLLNDLEKNQKAPADEQGPLSVTIAQSRPQPPAPTPQPKQEEAAQQPLPTPRPAPQTKSPPVTKPAKPRPLTPQPRSQIAIANGRTPPVVSTPTTAQPPSDAPSTPPQPVQPTPPVASSFEEELAIRQKSRRAANGGAPDEVVESDNERANRIAKANILAQQRSASPGQDPDQSGGIFDLRHTGLTEAEFVFNGWNRDFRRGMGKTFEVRAKDGDINMAVVRQMIEIIREQQPGDFTWYGRSHKEIVMSARPKDQKELELFLLKEFYPADPRINSGLPRPNMR